MHHRRLLRSGDAGRWTHLALVDSRVGDTDRFEIVEPCGSGRDIHPTVNGGLMHSEYRIEAGEGGRKVHRPPGLAEVLRSELTAGGDHEAAVGVDAYKSGHLPLIHLDEQESRADLTPSRFALAIIFLVRFAS